MTPNISIHPASPNDGRALGDVMLRAMEVHMIDRFMVPSEDTRTAFQEKMTWFLSSYGDSLADKSKRVFKAVDVGSGEIVGIGGIQFHDGVFPALPAAPAEVPEKDADVRDLMQIQIQPVEEALPAEKKAGFAAYYFQRSGQVHRKHMEGIKHVVWTTLHVRPDYQGKGVGGAMLRWGFKEFDLEKELVWLNTQMRGRNIYRRFGWVDIDHFDVDLSDWGGKLRGFGIHRTPMMLRQPGPFRKLDGFVDE